MEQIQDFDP